MTAPADELQIALWQAEGRIAALTGAMAFLLSRLPADVKSDAANGLAAMLGDLPADARSEGLKETIGELMRFIAN